jgi:hypothetical protein
MNFIWEYDMEKQWGGPFSLGTTCYIWTSLGTGNGEHDYLIMGEDHSIGNNMLPMDIIGNRKWGT